MGHPRYSSEEIAERGREWYERKIRFEIGEGNEGKPLIIDIETGEYEIDDDDLAASHRALAKHPGAALYGMRIGYPAFAKIGGSWGNSATVITGRVTEAREAVVSVRLRSASGSAEIRAVIDTGFTESLTLPSTLVASLELPYVRSDSIVLAGDSVIEVPVHECVVAVGAVERTIRVYCMEGTPLLGMRLLDEHLLTMEITTGGAVTVTPLG